MQHTFPVAVASAALVASLAAPAHALPEAGFSNDESAPQSGAEHGKYQHYSLDAALLSLTPLPVDFGNFYAHNPTWGYVYTGAELGLGGGMAWIGAHHLCIDGARCESWSNAEGYGLAGLMGAYFVVKAIAAGHAVSAAESYSRRQVAFAVVPTGQGVTSFVSVGF